MDQKKSAYRVTFYREVNNSYGRPYLMPLRTIDIEDCADKRSAASSAIKAFEAERRVSRWDLVAHSYEVS